MAANHDNKKVGIVVVPYLAHSHLNMSFHLSQLIVSSYGIPVHYVSSTQHIKQLKLRIENATDTDHNNNDDHGIIFHDFSVPSCDQIVDVFRTVPDLYQPVSDLLRDLSSKYDKLVVIHDALMSCVVKDVTTLHNAQSYTFNTVSAFSLFVSFWKVIPVKPFELDPPDAVPSVLPSDAHKNLPSEFTTFITEQYKLNYLIDAGTLYNDSRAINGTYFRLFEKLLPMKKHFAVGPLISKNIVLNRLNATDDQDACTQLSKKVQPHASGTHRCLEWLDCQEKESVLYISFGTTISLPENQIQELATALVRSGQNFLWVLRKADKGDIFISAGDSQEDELKKLLPEGFMERVGDKGMVVSEEWVPQLEILGHPSVGGFLTHCGWGSLTESMSMGVPVIACPNHSDQPLNAVLVTQILKIGLLIRDDFWETHGELISSDILENAVKRLMDSEEGQVMRRKAKDVGQALRGSMAQGGASQLDLDSFIAHVTS